jgi:hypothetical protein
MWRKMVGLLVVTVLCGVASDAVAQQQRVRLPRSEAAKADFANLSAEQRQQIATITAARAEAVAAWEAENESKLAELQAAVATARESEDRAARRSAEEALSTFRAPVAEINAKYNAQIRGLLNADQLLAWDAEGVYTPVVRNLRRAEPTEQQLAQIREKALQTQKQIQAAEAAGDASAARNLSRGFANDVRDSILTPAQREILAAPREQPAAN